ncbi:MAG: formate/nitrite transporter family protein [Bryobacteraceae bacterium]
MSRETVENKLDLSQREIREAERRSTVSASVVHEAIRREGEQELQRSASALLWSGLAAGLSMGFSLIAEGLLRASLPDAPWRPLVSKLGYSYGFLLVVLGRQQLFTENTLTPILPVMLHRDRAMLLRALRLWALVLVSNLTGALIIACVLSQTGAFQPQVRAAFAAIGRESLSVSFGQALLRGVFAGWLIAFMVWLLPLAEAFRVVVIVALTWLVGVAHLTHIIAGSVETLYLATAGQASFEQVAAGYMLPTLLGNILGGVALVAALNHAQVVSK